MMATFAKRTRIAAPARRVFAWHATPDALEKLVPPWEPVEIVQPPSGLEAGCTAVLRIGYGPAKIRWTAEHTAYDDRGDDGGSFTDIQVSGPFAEWEHRHTVTADGPDACVLEDHVTYELPLGFLGRLFGGALTRHKLRRMFDYRHDVTRRATEDAA